MKQARLVVLCAVWVVAFAGLSCRSERGEQSRESLGRAGEDTPLDASRWLGDPTHLANLTVWPIYTASPIEIDEFLTLEEAEEEGLAVVRELGASQNGGAQASGAQQIERWSPFDDATGAIVTEDLGSVGDLQLSGAVVEGDEAEEPPTLPEAPPPEDAEDAQEDDVAQALEQPAQAPEEAEQVGGIVQVVQSSLPEGGARVNSVVIENKGDLPILVCAGTVIQGGQQDRQIARDLVIAPKKTVPVDAFCVESGRWVAVQDNVSTGGVFKSRNIVAPKGVRSAAQYEGDQSEVWQAVAISNSMAGNAPETGTLFATILDDDEESLARRERLEKSVLEHFSSASEDEKRPVGFAYAIDGEPVTVRTFAHPRLLEKQLPGFVKAMCLEADLAALDATAEGKEVHSEVASADKVVAMVRRISEAQEKLGDTSTGHRYGLRVNDVGGNATCYLEISQPAADGGEAKAEWVPLTEDWTAK